MLQKTLTQRLHVPYSSQGASPSVTVERQPPAMEVPQHDYGVVLSEAGERPQLEGAAVSHPGFLSLPVKSLVQSRTPPKKEKNQTSTT